VATFSPKRIRTIQLFLSKTFFLHESPTVNFVVLVNLHRAGGRYLKQGDMKMKPWMKIVIPVAAILAVAAWYTFRPERLLVNQHVDEAMPTGQGGLAAQPLESGRFHSILHPTEGTATIYQMGDGIRVLRLTSFSTSNGPDVHVYMVAADDAKDAATVEKAGFVDLGVIKGNIGDQNYLLGSDLDLTKYRAVSIWCKRFSVNFGAAALRPTQTSQNQ
jgi:Electron transfer DM13